MKRKQFSEEQIIGILKEAEAGAVVTELLKAKAITVKNGTLVDGTIIASTSQGDDDARWVKHKGKPTVHGF